jgi:hypothetical protein
MDTYVYIPFIPVCVILANIFIKNVVNHTDIPRKRRYAVDHIVIKVKESEQDYLNTEL